MFSFVPWYKHLELARCNFKIASHLSSLLHLSFAFWTVVYLSGFYLHLLAPTLLYFLCFVVDLHHFNELWNREQENNDHMLWNIYFRYRRIWREKICSGNFFSMVNTGGPTPLVFTALWALLVQINFKTQSLSFWQEYSSNQLELAR